MTKESNSYTPIFKSVQQAGRSIAHLPALQVQAILKQLALSLISHTDFILEENQKDLNRMSVDDPKYDRLKLTPQRIKDIAGEINVVADLPSPLGKILEERTMGNGLHITKTTVPLGVIGIIYEARPNVTLDVFSLCLKSGNACILKGGSDAAFSNIAIVQIIKTVLREQRITEHCIALLPATREASTALLQAVGIVDVIIPRGSSQLINYVRDHSKVPVIETGAGIVHVYFDEYGSAEQGRAIVYNAKTRRVSVCNALDCLIIHAECLPKLHELTIDLAAKNVIIYADEPSYKVLQHVYPEQMLFRAADEHFGTEFLDYKLAVKTVHSLEEALNHIAAFGSKHSETIISENKDHINRFLHEVDAAVVYANVSSAFTDGAQFGLGAEIGISTQKLHARGPMGLSEMCSYKWQVTGNGQVRN